MKTSGDTSVGSDRQGAAPPVAAVVGAGMSGLVCAATLAHHGLRVRVFDKARGAGGRMSTRRAGEWRFDHGAQYFTVSDPRFALSVEGWRASGVVAPWSGQIAVLDSGEKSVSTDDTARWVAVPGMNAICRQLASGLEVAYDTRVSGLQAERGGWRLRSTDGADLGRFDAVVLSAPAPQTAVLLEDASPDLAARAAAVTMAPCWAVMVGFPGPLELGFDGAFVAGSPLSWAARNASKPERPDAEAWVLHASSQWSTEHLELDGREAARRLVAAFGAAVGGLAPAPCHVEAHRWRHALPSPPLRELCLAGDDGSLVACGDWCGGPRVEGAFLSGLAAAERILGRTLPKRS